MRFNQGFFITSRIYSFCLFLSFSLSGCSSLLYHPTNKAYYSPEDINPVKPADIAFMAEDGVKLHGWYFDSDPNKGPKGLFVFFHGNAENLSSHFAALFWVLKEGYNYFIFDYRGFGKSEGKPSPEGTILDGKAALRWAYEKNKNIPIIVFGQSLGTAVALRTVPELKEDVPIKLVVVEAAFHSYKKAGQKVLSKSFLTWLFQPLAHLVLSDKHAPKNHIAKISPTPIIVIHGTEDHIVDYSLGEKVYELAEKPKEFWRVEGGRHMDSFRRHEKKYQRRLIEAIELL